MEYFINPSCYGDDVAKWLIKVLKAQGIRTDEAPSPEDFGWYFNVFSDGNIGHTLVIGYRPNGKNEPGIWIIWLERKRGFIGSLLGARTRGVKASAAQAIHRVLSGSQFVFNLRWHFRYDFEADRQELGSVSP